MELIAFCYVNQNKPLIGSPESGHLEQSEENKQAFQVLQPLG